MWIIPSGVYLLMSYCSVSAKCRCTVGPATGWSKHVFSCSCGQAALFFVVTYCKTPCQMSELNSIRARIEPLLFCDRVIF